MRFSDRTLAGLLAFAGGAECIIGISVAEELYPGYSVSANFISDLGATCRASSCTIVEPASIVFNSSVALLGLLGIIAAYFLYRDTRRRIVTSFLLLAGIGALGVGFFPENTGAYHVVFSLIVFLFGGSTAIASFQLQESPLNYVSVLLGAMTLVALSLFLSGTYLGLGQGGMERMIAYPALLWWVGFGAYMMRQEKSALSSLRA